MRSRRQGQKTALKDETVWHRIKNLFEGSSSMAPEDKRVLYSEAAKWERQLQDKFGKAPTAAVPVVAEETHTGASHCNSWLGDTGFDWGPPRAPSLIPGKDSGKVKDSDRQSNKAMIICAGEGSTGTRSLHAALAQLGYVSAHYDSVLVPDPHIKFRANNAPNKLTNSFSMHTAWITYMRNKEYDHFDFRIFDEFDAIGDTPIPQYFPFLLDAYPNSKVILTVRNATEWAIKRPHRGNIRRDPAPFASLFHSIRNSKKWLVVEIQTLQTYERLYITTITLILLLCMRIRQQ